ncbi:MAG: type VII secretion protein EccCa [Sporichthyaceae bacterium]
MTTVRPSYRPEAPVAPQGQVVLQPPPELVPAEGGSSILQNLLPMLASVGSVVFVATTQPGGRGYATAGMFLVASLGFVAVSVLRQRGQRTSKVADQRREYLRYLSGVRATAREAATRQRDALTWSHPDPAHLPGIAADRTRIWERSPADPTFLAVRYGVTAQPLSLELVAPESAPIDQLDPVAASALHRLLTTHRVQPDLPAAFELRAFAKVELTGANISEVRALARAVLTQAASFHSPEHLVIAVVAGSEARADWEWVKWLPHNASPRERDGAGAARQVADSLEDLIPLLPEELTERPRFGAGPVGANGAPLLPHVLVVVDGGHIPASNPIVTPEGVAGVTVLELPQTWTEVTDPHLLRFGITDQTRPDGRIRTTAATLRGTQATVWADQPSVAEAEALARRLAPMWTTSAKARSAAGSAGVADLFDLLGIGDVRDFDIDTAWEPRSNRDRLRVPVGNTEDGTPVAMDIKESAQQGMGPHGLVVGATGSGKSEFLRTLVLGLVVTHSPDALNLILVDFKGGATFAGMSELPHVSAVITNLADELTLVDRMQDALAGEMVRRQELLREAGNFASVKDYEKARVAGADLAPLPSLFIVVDEFSELLSAKPDFAELFVAIGRLGRSLSIHLLLATQRLEEGRLKGLDSHLSYRVGLRTFSAQESRTVLGVDHAYTLPPVPGLGYLKPDQSTLIRFTASYVSGPPPVRRAAPSGPVVAARIVPFTTIPVLLPAAAQSDLPEPEPEQTETRSEVDIVVERMRGRGPAAHQVWLPPLDEPDTLDSLLADLAVVPGLGLISPSWRAKGSLVVPLGAVDKPAEQCRDTLVVDLGGAGGNLAVVGGPRSGKSTLLRTLVTSLALTRTPAEVQCYVLDFGGGTFTSLTGLPHIAGVGTRSEPDIVRRILAEVVGITNAREAYFRANGIDSIETYRARKLAGTADDGYGDVFLLIDGWATIRADFDALELELTDLASRGLTFGIHLVVTSARWNDFRSTIKDLFGTRLELRLGDPSDSELDRKAAGNVPAARPGRGIVPGPNHVLIALPRVDGDNDPATLGAGIDHLVQAISTASALPSGPKLRLLPERISLEEVRAAATTGDQRLLLGVGERDLAPLGLNPAADPMLTVYGDGGSGKSALLRTYAREVMRLFTPAQAQLAVVDYRRALLGEVPEEYLFEYMTGAAGAGPAVAELAQFLKGRLPGPDVTPAQLRERSWWTGKDVYLIVDDYELVSGSTGSPLAPLVELLPQARDIGLHLVIARRSGGASRALYEPVIQAMRDLASPGIILPGDPSEGALVGNARPQPGVPGRAQLVTRERGIEVVQIAWAEPAT